MNIHNFKNALIGGGARANLFRVNGTFPAAAVGAASIAGGGNPSNQIQFLCSAAQLPQFSIDNVNIPFQGRQLKLPGDRSFAEWTITVLNDNNFALRNAFEKWQDVINRIESNVSRNSLSEYAQQWSVTQLDRTQKDVKTYTFIDCWPSVVSAIDLSMEPATSVESFQVTLQYQYYQAEGTSS
jgi:hypothetical protein